MIYGKLNQQKYLALLTEHVNASKTIQYPTYEPCSWQAEEFHKSPAHIKALFGGDRAGKSGTAAAEMVKRIREYKGEDEIFWVACLTEDKIPPVWQWYKSLLAEQEIVWERVEWRKTGRIPKIVPTIYGSHIEFKTMRSGSGAFAAESVRAIHLDEDGARVTSDMSEIYTDCCSRIFDRDGYLIISATPVLGMNWMYKRVYSNPDPDIQSWNVSADDNRFISADKKAKQLARLTADEIDRRYKGMFTILSGACFKEYNRDIHLLKEPAQISGAWRRIRVIDFGYEHDFCCLWIACSPTGILYIYDEYFAKGKLLAEHAKEIYDRTVKHMYSFVDPINYMPIESTVADHDKQDRAELENPLLGECAIYTVPAIKEVDTGIQKVNRYLKDGRLFIFPHCQKTAEQFSTYHYKFIKEGAEEKEVVFKLDDEAPDCVRYGVEYFDSGSSFYEVLT
jgi:phage terminase large subunit